MPLTTTDSSVINTPSSSAGHLLELSSSVTIGTSSSNKLPHLPNKENKTEKQSKTAARNCFSVNQIKRRSEILQK